MKNNMTLSKPKHPEDLGEGYCAACGEWCREMNQDDSYDDGLGNVTCWSTVSACCEAEVLDEDPNSEEVLKKKLAYIEGKLAKETERADRYLYYLYRIRETPESAVDLVALALTSWKKKGGE